MHTRRFTVNDILVPLNAPESHRRPWNPRVPSLRRNLHLGQVKLLATEMALLTLFADITELTVVVYAGAAGGHHIPALAELYPDIQFYLYDPAPFAIEANSQLHIIPTIFTDEIAREWGEGDRRVIFISDVRTSGDTSEEHEAEVESNMAMQARWVELMLPALDLFSLKFRIPYTVIEADLPFRYLKGKLIYQPYPKADSMELRLIGTASQVRQALVDYDSRGLEKIVFYHNSVERPDSDRYANVFTGNDKPYDDPQFDRGYDCTYFLFCVRRWLIQCSGRSKSSAVSSVSESEGLELARKLLRITSQGRWTLGQRKRGVST